MARHHRGYVNIYRSGASGDKSSQRRKYREKYNQEAREEAGYPICPRCGNRYKNPDHAHYLDFKNKIRCLPKKG